jgi:hypothetical protein
MGAIRSSETSVQFTRSTLRHIPEDAILRGHMVTAVKISNLENGDDTFLRNIGSIHKIYTALHPR